MGSKGLSIDMKLSKYIAKNSFIFRSIVAPGGPSWFFNDQHPAFFHSTKLFFFFVHGTAQESRVFGSGNGSLASFADFNGQSSGEESTHNNNNNFDPSGTADPDWEFAAGPLDWSVVYP